MITAHIPKSLLKKFLLFYLFIYLFCVNINMINLLLNELKLVAKNRNIKDYKNNSKKELRKILSKSKPKKNSQKNQKEIRRNQKKFRGNQKRF